MIFIAVGANLPSDFGSPRQACAAALARLERDGDIALLHRSGWWETAPVPLSDQPWYVNGVVAVDTRLPPEDLLARLHGIEAEMGRVRTVANAPRVIDLDLLAYGQEVRRNGPLLLPHPRMQDRLFVLAPLAEIAPDWRHPVLGVTASALLAALPDAVGCGQTARRLPADPA